MLGENHSYVKAMLAKRLLEATARRGLKNTIPVCRPLIADDSHWALSKQLHLRWTQCWSGPRDLSFVNMHLWLWAYIPRPPYINMDFQHCHRHEALSVRSSFSSFLLVRQMEKLQSSRWRWQCIAGPSGYRRAWGLRECGLARFPYWAARRWGRTAVDVLLSDCQYRKGTALYELEINLLSPSSREWLSLALTAARNKGAKTGLWTCLTNYTCCLLFTLNGVTLWSTEICCFLTVWRAWNGVVFFSPLKFWYEETKATSSQPRNPM